jgi:hypothetical protein
MVMANRVPIYADARSLVEHVPDRRSARKIDDLEKGEAVARL